ncbi:MAG: transketolase C-terminal domain-containing protein [Myxococcota bacterium]
MSSSSLGIESALREVLRASLSEGDRTILLGENLVELGGFDGSTNGLAADYPDRVRDVPIADRAMVGVAVGLALGGKRPVIHLADTARLYGVLEPLAEAGRLARDSDFDVPLVVRLPYGREAPGLDQPVGPVLADLPGVAVWCASTPALAPGLLATALQQRTPTVVLQSRTLATHRGRVSVEAAAPGPREVRAGHHVTLATWGPALPAAMRAAEALEAEGVSCQVIDLVTLAPIDHAWLGARVQQTGRLVVVHPSDPGLARHVRHAGLDAAFLYLEAPLGEAHAHPDAVVEAARAAVHY